MKVQFLIKLFPVLLMFINGCSGTVTDVRSEAIIASPEELYGDLFFDVQGNNEVFADSKTFVDCVPLFHPSVVRSKYAVWPDRSANGLREFIRLHFQPPVKIAEYVSDSSSISDHIKKLWQVLRRPADEKKHGTLIPLPHPYIVPGGRFREVYYWDSFFTMLGLREDGQDTTIENTVKNFAYLLDNFGFIPNGNRSYYLSRSQPPFFASMVQLLASMKGDDVFTRYLSQMETEYDFWMQGADSLTRDEHTYKRVVRLQGGEVMNRYWDDKATPRPESYAEDVQTMSEVHERFPERDAGDVFRHLRAGAESGWDFSSRWLEKETDGSFKLHTIHTTDIIPVDLNCLLYDLELTIARAARLGGYRSKALDFEIKAAKRKEAIFKYCWDQKRGFFMDHNFVKGKNTGIESLAAVFPLYFRIADTSQADLVAKRLEKKFLKPGGLVTTLDETGQQWDGPNGWAPLQYLAVMGLRNFGINKPADEIQRRWLRLNEKVYAASFKLMEKYNVQDTSRAGGGGEYPNQDGFGWTNGVYRAFVVKDSVPL